MAADPRFVAALQRFYTQTEIETAYQTAMAAYISRQTEVTIESFSGEGGTSTGRLIGDPAEIMDACEQVLSSLSADAADAGTLVPGTTHVDFSKRYISP